jgi:hypothetical protein
MKYLDRNRSNFQRGEALLGLFEHAFSPKLLSAHGLAPLTAQGFLSEAPYVLHPSDSDRLLGKARDALSKAEEQDRDWAQAVKSYKKERSLQEKYP